MSPVFCAESSQSALLNRTFGFHSHVCIHYFLWMEGCPFSKMDEQQIISLLMFMLQEKKLTVVSDYKYLSVTIHSNLTFKK